MVPYWQSRTELLLGTEAVEGLQNKHVLVVGLGGVGGICAEMIVRAGVGAITIVDADVVDASNCNRQIPATQQTVGKPKADVMAERLLAINPALNIQVVKEFLTHDTMPSFFEGKQWDYVADCIDTLSCKVALIETCIRLQLPIASSMGAGGRLDPTGMKIADLYKSKNCTLAKYVRKRLGKTGVGKGITVVYSDEAIDHSRVIVSEKAAPKKTLIGTISYMPAIFGCATASIVLRGLLNRGKQEDVQQ